MTEFEFPRIIICHGDGHGYDRRKVSQFGYEDYSNLLYGRSANVSSYGWVPSNITTKALFEQLYSKPFIETIIRPDSFIKLNGSTSENLTWKEIPMMYPEGRCLKLNFTKTIYKETTIILKFQDIKNFNGSLEISITGRNAFKIYVDNNFCVLDPYREYFKPDIFSFGGDKDKMDFQAAHQSFDVYRIKIFENRDREEDVEAKCRHYSGEAGLTYKDCVLTSIKNDFEVSRINGTLPLQCVRSHLLKTCRERLAARRPGLRMSTAWFVTRASPGRTLTSSAPTCGDPSMPQSSRIVSGPASGWR